MKNNSFIYSKKKNTLSRLLNFALNFVFFFILSVCIIFNPIVYQLVNKNKKQIIDNVQIINLWITYIFKICENYFNLCVDFALKYKLVNDFFKQLLHHIELINKNDSIYMLIIKYKKYFTFLIKNLNLILDNVIVFYK